MSHECFNDNCKRTDTELVDATCGPLADYRYYCPEHLPAYQKQAKISHAEREILYLTSVIGTANKEIAEILPKLKHAQEELRKVMRDI